MDNHWPLIALPSPGCGSRCADGSRAAVGQREHGRDRWSEGYRTGYRTARGPAVSDSSARSCAGSSASASPSVACESLSPAAACSGPHPPDTQPHISGKQQNIPETYGDELRAQRTRVITETTSNGGSWSSSHKLPSSFRQDSMLLSNLFFRPSSSAIIMSRRFWKIITFLKKTASSNSKSMVEEHWEHL